MKTAARKLFLGGPAVMVATVAAALGATPDTASADLLAYWHFNGGEGQAPAIISADVGNGEIDRSGYGTPAGGLGFGTTGSGTTVNALPGFEAGVSLSFSGIPGADAIGMPIYITISMSGYQDMQISFAARKLAPAGSSVFTQSEWAWATGDDPTNFTVMPGVSTANTITTWATRQVDFSSITALNNAEVVILRHKWTGLANAGGQSWDNFQINATAIPAPGALALLGLAGLLGTSRRNRNRNCRA